MNFCTKKFLPLLIGLAICSLAFSSEGAVTFDGRLGVDYEFYDHITKGTKEIVIDPDSSIFQDTTYVLQKAISNHYLEVSLRGDIVNSDFATFGLRSKIYGTYFRTADSDSLATAYLSPNLRGLTTQLALFPTRSYPIRLFYSNTEDHVLKHEEKNQDTEGSLHPARKVVSRYDSETKANG